MTHVSLVSQLAYMPRSTNHLFCLIVIFVVWEIIDLQKLPGLGVPRSFLSSEARHAQSEATGFVMANRT